jgi:hypothetical protein
MGGVGEVRVITARGGEGEPADANCPESMPIAIAGGGSMDEKGGALEVSAPITKGTLSSDGQRPTGWRVRSQAGVYTAYVICSGSGKGEEGEEASEREIAEKEAAESAGK